jgi:hypothetical protein
MRTPQLGSQKGQAITEAVLILIMMFAIVFAVANYFKDKEVLKQLITGPFANLAGMFQNGVWQPPDKGAASHPTGHFRHISIQGEGVR